MAVESTMAYQAPRIIAFAVDESEYAEHAFNCKYRTPFNGW